MKILTKNQIQQWDQFTIAHEPVSSLGLMERAAARCFHLLIQHLNQDFSKLVNKSFQVFCAQGNNGGDGLVIARYLKSSGYQVNVFILNQKEKGTEDFELNLLRCQAIDINPILLSDVSDLPSINDADIIIDALFGTGLNTPVSGFAKDLILFLNLKNAVKLAIDLPSGLFADANEACKNLDATVFEAHRTYTFQVPKSSFLFPESGNRVGNFFIIDIDLLPAFLDQTESDLYWLNPNKINKPKDSKFSYKWQKGHALIIGGSEGKVGAALLASRAALRAGAGLVTAHIPKIGYQIFQTALPEVMVLPDVELNELRNFPVISSYAAVCVGPGMGLHSGTIKSFGTWFSQVETPLVIDADALNACAVLMQQNSNFCFPKNSIITPHAKEFDRLFGAHQHAYERLQTAIKNAIAYQIVIVLKGTYTQVIDANGKVSFNSSGNSLLATAGSGDVLSGIITAMLAQGLNSIDAATYGVYLHGALANSLKCKNYVNCIAGDFVDELRFIR
ncbi:MAG: NAD(P)H-hydrate dehydratase [bacterium]|nr:NAD(P)H-hydrate dehydratase [bacterium]